MLMCHRNLSLVLPYRASKLALTCRTRARRVCLKSLRLSLPWARCMAYSLSFWRCCAECAVLCLAAPALPASASSSKSSRCVIVDSGFVIRPLQSFAACSVARVTMWVQLLAGLVILISVSPTNALRKHPLLDGIGCSTCKLLFSELGEAASHRDMDYILSKAELLCPFLVRLPEGATFCFAYHAWLIVIRAQCRRSSTSASALGLCRAGAAS